MTEHLNRPDYILYNGNFISMENETARYAAASVTNGRLTALYREDEPFPKQYFGTKMIDLQGKTVLPGFIDNNVHLVQSGLLQYCVKIDARTKEAFMEELKHKADSFEDGELIWCIGYHEEYIDVDRWDLDRVSSKHPIVVSKTEFHKTVVNTCAYNLLQIPSSVPGIMRDQRNMPTGVLQGEASGFARRKLYMNFISDDLRRNAVSDVESTAFANGITTVNAMEGGAFFSNRDIDAVNSFSKESRLEIILFPQTMDVSRVSRMGLSRVGGNIYLDGAIGSKTAALYGTYAGSTQSGSLYYSQDAIDQFVLEAHSAGLQISLSCIGPRAIRQVLDAFSSAFEAVGRGNHRHRLELFVLPDADQIERAVSLGLLFSVRPNYDRLWGGESGMYSSRIGDLWKNCNPIGDISRKGGILCSGSEYSVTPLNPLDSIQACVLHHCENQRISLYEALKSYTVNGAYANFAEDRLGKLKAGMQADMVVLGEDPFLTAPEKLSRIPILMTLKKGRIVYAEGESLW